MATFSPLKRLLALADRERVEQRLRRMLVHAVAGVDDAERQMRDSRWHAPDDEWRSTIMSGRHRLEVERGVGQRLAFDDARRARWRC